MVDHRLFGLATRLLVGRLHSQGELRAKLLRLALRADTRTKRINFSAKENDGSASAGSAVDEQPTLESSSSGMGSAVAAIDAVIAELVLRGLVDDEEYALWHGA